MTLTPENYRDQKGLEHYCGYVKNGTGTSIVHSPLDSFCIYHDHLNWTITRSGERILDCELVDTKGLAVVLERPVKFFSFRYVTKPMSTLWVGYVV